MKFVKITDHINENDEFLSEHVVEIPVEGQTNEMLLSTVTSQYPTATGLRYKIDSCVGIDDKKKKVTWRAVQLIDGRFISPDSDNWETDRTYHVTVTDQSNRKRRVNSSSFPSNVDEGKQSCGSCHDLIVLGLPYETTDLELCDYFQKYGKLNFFEVKRYGNGKSKGFAFIRYDNIDAQRKALGQKHRIGKRLCELRVPDSVTDHKTKEKVGTFKLFVGRLPIECSEEHLRNYFLKFGNLVDVYIPKPFRQFGFITYNELASVQKVLQVKEHKIFETTINVKEADPRYKNDNIHRFQSPNRQYTKKFKNGNSFGTNNGMMNNNFDYNQYYDDGNYNLRNNNYQMNEFSTNGNGWYYTPKDYENNYDFMRTKNGRTSSTSSSYSIPMNVSDIYHQQQQQQMNSNHYYPQPHHRQFNQPTFTPFPRHYYGTANYAYYPDYSSTHHLSEDGMLAYRNMSRNFGNKSITTSFPTTNFTSSLDNSSNKSNGTNKKNNENKSNHCHPTAFKPENNNNNNSNYLLPSFNSLPFPISSTTTNTYPMNNDNTYYKSFS
ncbi:hypothetical protein SNEBB_007823 [Seison nebaliae]|nr:hypothetical protein SNEBB_007823 [Seison nebaliae]